MKVTCSSEGSRLTLRIVREQGDPEAQPGRPQMNGELINFRLPSAWRLEDVHPDLLALAALLCVRPFAGAQVSMWPVSRGFQEAVYEHLGLELNAVDPHLASRHMRDGRPGLAFSGGVDSVAALSVLPRSSASVHLDRTLPPGRPAVRSLYRPDAAQHACRALAGRGYTVAVVQTDLEHVRSPVGFPTDLAPAAPLVLLGDLLRLDCVSWGTIAESAYRVGHQAYVDYFTRSAYTNWAPIFLSAGLPIMNPMAGVSEVGTSLIVLAEGLGDIAQSCIRGEVGRPCRNCWKCFRKSLLDSALTNQWPRYDQIDDLFRIPEARTQLAKVPIKHENVVAYLVARYSGDHPLMLALAQRTRAQVLDLAYLEKWYPPSAGPWPEKYRVHVESRLDRLLGRMSADEEERFRGWSMAPVTDVPADKRRAQLFGSLHEAWIAYDAVRPSYEGSDPAPTVRQVERKRARILRRISELQGRDVKPPAATPRRHA